MKCLEQDWPALSKPQVLINWCIKSGLEKWMHKTTDGRTNKCKNMQMHRQTNTYITSVQKYKTGLKPPLFFISGTSHFKNSLFFYVSNENNYIPVIVSIPL